MKERFLRLMNLNTSQVTFGTFHGVFYGILRHTYHLSGQNILSEEKDLNEMKNWPLTKEAEDNFEIPEEVMTDEDYEILQMNTQYHKQTVRSGQVIKSNGNVVIIGDCHPGCEIHAAGDITVWGILGGIAHALSLIHI